MPEAVPGSYVRLYICAVYTRYEVALSARYRGPLLTSPVGGTRASSYESERVGREESGERREAKKRRGECAKSENSREDDAARKMRSLEAASRCCFSNGDRVRSVILRRIASSACRARSSVSVLGEWPEETIEPQVQGRGFLRNDGACPSETGLPARSISYATE